MKLKLLILTLSLFSIEISLAQDIIPDSTKLETVVIVPEKALGNLKTEEQLKIEKIKAEKARAKELKKAEREKNKAIKAQKRTEKELNKLKKAEAKKRKAKKNVEKGKI